MKECYEKKEVFVLKICGLLDKNADDEYTVYVEDKDGVKEYLLSDIIESLNGKTISLSSESETNLID